MASFLPHHVCVRQPLAPRDTNVNVQSLAPSTPTKSIPITAYDLLKNMDTPSPRGLAGAHQAQELTSQVGRQSEVTRSSLLPPPASVVASVPCNTTHESPTSLEGQQDDGAHDWEEKMSTARVADGVMRLLESPDQSVLPMQGDNLLPPAWNDLLQFLASLPLHSRTGSIADAAKPDAPPHTTIGLMVKADTENDGLGLVTGWIEGSTCDLSQEMMVGDVVLAVDGTPFNNPDSLKKMRGGHVVVAAGTEMRLTLQRHGTGVFDCALVREPYASMQLKREIFDLLSRLKTTFDAGQAELYQSPFGAVGEMDNTSSLLACVRAKLVELENTNVHTLRLVRSELQGLQHVLEQVVLQVNRAAAQGEETIRSLTDRIGKQDDDLAYLSSRLEALPYAAEAASEPVVDHKSHDQVHLLRHECNRLRNSLQTKELELEGLRESFDRKLDAQGLRDTADDRSIDDLPQSRPAEIQSRSEDQGHCGMLSQALDVAGLQALLDQERESNSLAQAALKRDLWVSVIRRWLNNCCRKIIAGWRSELARKQHHGVFCAKLGRSCRRRHIRFAFLAFVHMQCESRRLRHAGVSAASGWLFLGVRKHLRAWLAHVDWKAYTQRLESKCRAKSVARVFHAWSRIFLRSTPGLDSDGVAAIMMSLSESQTPGAKENSQSAVELNQDDGATVPPRVKAAVGDKGSQTLRWESDAAIQCCLQDRVPVHAVAKDAPQPCRNSPQVPQQTAVAAVSTGTQCDADKGASDAKQPIAGCKEDSFLFRGLQEQFDQERKESQRLRASLATAQESLRRQDAMLRGAHDSDRRLKESLQMAHAQLQRSLKSANEDRHRAAQLGQELEQAERKLLMSHEERDELRIIVSDERRINARGNSNTYPALTNPRAAISSRRHSPPNLRLGVLPSQKAVAVTSVSTHKMRLMCLNMALSKQWRRLAAIFESWSAYVLQYTRQREGVMRITARRFYASIRVFLGVWAALSKCACRTRVLLAVTLSQRLRRVLRHVLKVMKRAMFESRAARELYGLEDSISSPPKAAQHDKAVKAPHSITRPRLNAMAQKIKQGRRTMCSLDQSVAHVNSEVQKYEQAFRSAEAVIDELAQRIHCLYEEDAERKGVASPAKTEPLSATIRPPSKNDKQDKGLPSSSKSDLHSRPFATLTAHVLQAKVATGKSPSIGGQQHTMFDASSFDGAALHRNGWPHSYPCKPPSLDSPQPKEHHKDRKYRVLGNLMERSEHHVGGTEPALNVPGAAAWPERQMISPGLADVSFASSGPPPTPSEYSTGPGRDGNRGSPSPQPMDSPGVLSPVLHPFFSAKHPQV